MLDWNGASGTGCQMPKVTFVVDTNCQVVKLPGQENCRMSSEAKETESEGDCASTRDVAVNTHRATPKVFRLGHISRKGITMVSLTYISK